MNIAEDSLVLNTGERTHQRYDGMTQWKVPTGSSRELNDSKIKICLAVLAFHKY